jgi:ABC-2 type transport system permease protein
MASYPLPLYHEILQRFFTFVVPLAFVSYFPALNLLDCPELQRFPGWRPAATPVAAAMLAPMAHDVGCAFGVTRSPQPS